MTYINNFQPTKAFKNNNILFNTQYYKHPNISHLQIFDSTVYDFLYKKEQKLKLEE